MHEWRDYEIEVVPGLEEFVKDELLSHVGSEATVFGRSESGRVNVQYNGSLTALNKLRSAVATHVIEDFDIPRPRALLGHEHQTRLLGVAEEVVASFPPASFETYRISAAGVGSSTFRRLGDQIGATTGLVATDGPAHLHLAFRRTRADRKGWQALVRLSPMPLSARKWRVCHLPGALNATIAHVMVELAAVPEQDTVVNLACGSGTLIVERLELAPKAKIIGLDTSRNALKCAKVNLRAAGYNSRARLLIADARRVPLPKASAKAIVVDLPFGMLSGAGLKLGPLYSAILSEATYLAAPSAPLVMITSARRHLEIAIKRHEAYWQSEREISLDMPFRSGYIKLQLYVLLRRPEGKHT